MKRKQLSEINAGSMADIAFLLLIFFLVTTTLEVDQGIMSRIAQENPNHLHLKERNLLSIYINKNDEILVNNTTFLLEDLSEEAQSFIDNGAGKDIKGTRCDYCHGKQLPNSSDHPTKAVITIEADRAASYETYIKTLDKVHSAYNDLRNRLSLKLYNKNYNQLESEYKKTQNPKVYQKLTFIKSKYPLLIGNIENNSAMANQ